MKRYFLIFISLFILLVVVFFIFFFKTNYREYYPSSNQAYLSNKLFTSKYLKFDLIIPASYATKDEPTRIILNSSTGQIFINRNGTQYDNLNDYLKDFDNKTTLKTVKDEGIKINGNDARARIFDNSDINGGKEKIYFIYVDNFVYKFSTSSESLYNDLDQIAESFKYTP